MRVEIYQHERHRNLWEDFVQRQARNAHFMHMRRYLDYHEDRFEDHSLLFFGEKAEPIALLPANLNKKVLVSHGGLSFGGLLVGKKFRRAQWGEAFASIGKHMANQRLEELDYRPTPAWYHATPGEEDVFLFESEGAKPELLASAICRIDGGFFGNATRRTESRAEVRVGRDDVSLGALMGLVAETLRVRHSTDPVHSLAEMELLAGQFPSGIRCYTARSEGLVAGVVLFVSETVVKLQYVGYSDGAAMSSIYAHLFELEEFRGRWFDFGTSMGEGGVIDDGLFAYKESLGGRLASVRRFRIPVNFPFLKQC